MTAELTFPSPTQNPQDRALELLQRFLQHPGLARMRWSIGEDGSLTGYLTGHDLRWEASVYAAVLSVTPLPPLSYSNDGHRRVSQHVATTVDGLSVNLSFLSDLAAYPELLEAAECEFAAKFIQVHDDMWCWSSQTWLEYRAGLDRVRLEAAA
ncbi:hypothetical protein ACWGB8_01530 [Kitasatospora sp. NPDC054939]